MKLIHISDIHINNHKILDYDPVENFQTCMDHVAEHHADADMVVISGDLTHHGQEPSYTQLKSMLETWNVTPQLMLGNHDIRENFQAIFPNVARDENGFVQYTVEHDDAHFIFLDTHEEGTHSGNLCDKRLAWLEAKLDKASLDNKPAYLFMHHHPVDVGVLDSDNIGFIDQPSIQAVLKEYRNTIRHIFFGHCHYILSGSVFGIPFSAPRSTNHNSPPDFYNLTRSGIAPFPPTYNVCLINDDAVIIHSIDFKDEDKITWYEVDDSGRTKDDKS